VKVSSGFYSPDRIPSDGVVLTLGDSLVTVRADPTFIIIGFLAGGSLDRIFDTALKLCALYSDTNPIHIQRLIFGAPLGLAIPATFH
jgi:hypothetical protein